MGGVMRRGAIGCMIIVGGKIRGQRARTQKYITGYLISTGQPKHEFVDTAIRHVNMRQGVLGLKVSIMGTLERKIDGQTIVMPDYIKIHEPKSEVDQAAGPGVIFTRNRDDMAGTAPI